MPLMAHLIKLLAAILERVIEQPDTKNVKNYRATPYFHHVPLTPGFFTVYHTRTVTARLYTVLAIDYDIW